MPENTDIVGIRTIFNEQEYLDEEVYVYKNGDSLVNQQIFYKNMIIDSMRSNFYKLKLPKNSTENGSIFYNSAFKKYKNSKISNWKLEFFYLQNITKDSIDYVSVESQDLTTLTFPYKTYCKNVVQGVIVETLIIDTVINNKMMSRFLENVTLVDNIDPTDNNYPFSKSSKFKNK